MIILVVHSRDSLYLKKLSATTIIKIDFDFTRALPFLQVYPPIPFYRHGEDYFYLLLISFPNLDLLDYLLLHLLIIIYSANIKIYHVLLSKLVYQSLLPNHPLVLRCVF